MHIWRAIFLSISLGSMFTVAAAQAATSVKVTWTVPTVRENGQPLAASELSGYEVYYTTDTNASATIKVSGGSTSSYTVPNLAAGTYHFAISAIDTNGLKSKLSSVADITLAASSAVPNAATNMGVSIVSKSTTTGLSSIKAVWTPPTQRTDGTTLTTADISGYKINVYSYYGATISKTVSGGSVNSYTLSGLKPNFYPVELIAVDTNNRQSASVYQYVWVK